VIATSAARDAHNAADLLGAIRAATGLDPRIIAGEQEADWAYRGVRSDPTLAGHPLVILDIGGGSTEFILGAGAHPRFRHSFPIGTVRLLERFPHADPPTEADWRKCRAEIREFLDVEVAPAIEPKLRAFADPQVRWVGTGGSTTILARIELGLDRYDRARLEAVRLGHARMREHRRRLWSLPLAERKRVPGLPASRADVILLGVAICEGLMDRFDVPELRISTRGLRFGALLGG
jgi:exopolyphosphatase/guanosine-5'-triphosphate,3'-diphosphate pyrophosphatase